MEKCPTGRKQEPKPSPVFISGLWGHLIKGHQKTSLSCPSERQDTEIVCQLALPLWHMVTARPAEQALKPQETAGASGYCRQWTCTCHTSASGTLGANPKSVASPGPCTAWLAGSDGVSNPEGPWRRKLSLAELEWHLSLSTLPGKREAQMSVSLGLGRGQSPGTWKRKQWGTGAGVVKGVAHAYHQCMSHGNACPGDPAAERNCKQSGQ